MHEKISAHQLGRFRPIHLVKSSELTTLSKQSKQLFFLPGQLLLDSFRTRENYHFLVSGEIGLHNNRRFIKNFKDSHLQCEGPLEELVTKNQKIYATSHCSILRVNRSLLEALLASNSQSKANYHYDVIEVDSENADNQGTWLEKILQSSLISQLTPTNIQKLLSAFELEEVEKNATIIRHGDAGNYFYVIKEGYAKIRLDTKEEIIVGPGNFFGEEALAGNTTRNATVTMDTDGVLNRLCRDRFERIVQDELVKIADEPHKIRLLESGELENDVLLDVRLKAEYAKEHLPNSINIPVSELRQHLQTMDDSSVYYVSNDGGDRSKLATFLLRMSGKNAFLLPAA